MAHGGVKIEVDLDKSKLQGSMNGLQGDIVKGMAVFEVLKQGVAKIFNMVAESIDAATRRIDTMDQFSRVMTTMTGSTETANNALEKTNQIVTGTAFGLDTAAKGVQAFVASGMEVSKATDTMGAWADAVAFYTKGTNVELETVSMALQKMGTKGNVTMEHLQMLLEAGIPAIQIYASAVGVSTEDVTNQMSKGELKTSDFIAVMNEAFKTGTTGFPAIAGAAKTAGASWQGSQDNMKAAIARGTAAMLEQLDATFHVKEGMVSFGKGVEAVMKGLANNADKVAVAIAAMVAAFVTAKTLQSVATWMTAITKSTTLAGAAINLLTAAKTKEQIVTVAQMASESGLTTAQGIRAAVMGVLTGQTSIQTAATFALKVAQDALNKSMLANPIVLLMALIAALITVIIQAANRTNAAAEAARAEADALVAKQDELTQAAADSAAEYEKSMATLNANANEARLLADELEGLQAKTGRTIQEQYRMEQIIQQLSTQYPELSEMINKNTGKLRGNREAWNAVIDAQSEYDAATAMMERSNELTEQAKEAEILHASALNSVAQNQKEIETNQEKINSLNAQAQEKWNAMEIAQNDAAAGMVGAADKAHALWEEWDKLAGESDNLRLRNDGLKDANKNLEGSMDGLSEASKKAIDDAKAQADATKYQATVALRSYTDRLKGATTLDSALSNFSAKDAGNIEMLIKMGGELSDEEMKNAQIAIRAHKLNSDDVKKMAHQYKVSAESIVDDLDYIEGGAEAYAAKMEKSFTKDGHSLDQIAKKWGMSTDQITSYMDEWGMTLDEVDKELSNSVTAQGETLDDLAAKYGSTKEELEQLMVNEGWGVQELRDKVSETSQDIINDWEKLPKKYDKSLNQMIKIARENAARYAEWKSKMVYLSQNMSAESIEALQALGTGGLSVIDELIKGGPEKMAEFDAVMVEVTAVSVQDMLNQFGTLPPNVIEQFNLMNEGVGLKIDEMGVITDIKTGAVVSAFDATMRRLTPAVVDAFNQANIGAGIALDETGAIISTKSGEVIATAQEVFQSGALDAAVNGEWDKVGAALQGNPSVKNAMTANAQEATGEAGKVYGSADNFKAGSESQTQVAKGIESNKAPEQAARTKAQEVTKTFQTEFSGAAFVGLLSTAMTAMANQAKTNTALTLAMVANIQSARTSAEREANNGWADIGSNIVRGMADGVSRSASILTNAIVNVVKQGLQAAKNAADIHSPSKLFADQVGRMIPAGIGVGVDAGTPEAIASLKRMMNSVTSVGSDIARRSMGAKLIGTNASTSRIDKSVNLGGVTIVRPNETPGQSYRELVKLQRRLINR